jgi:SAM-dependent methyltransferase
MSPRPEDWNARWETKDTPWDLGGVTPALIDWSRDQTIKGTSILVPGCGLGHDAHFLAKRGGRVTAMDYAPEAIQAAKTRYPHPSVDWQVADVTRIDIRDSFDRVWEYTCFCALEPENRVDYLAGMAGALKPNGYYWGLVFQKVPNPEDGPPFEISPDAFHDLLSRFFEVDALEPGTNRSVKPRRGAEIWFVARKRARDEVKLMRKET